MGRQPMRDLKRLQRRRRKVRFLRRRLAAATNPQERQRLIAKLKKVSPTAPAPEK
jgi:hypothetical protein